MAKTKTNLYDGISETDLFIFNEGKNYQSYNFLGAHRYTKDGIDGYRFAVWAPNAEAVSVVGDFNGWDKTADTMEQIGSTGIWYTFIKNASQGNYYKFSITDKNGVTFLKSDPYAFFSEVRPGTASVIRDIGKEFKWSDKTWMSKREKTAPYDKPLSIYEVHAGSFKQHEDGSFYTYRELADELIPYVKEMGYTHIEFMPLNEFPFDGSWGYQATGYYSPTSRYGAPDELMEFINKCHKNNIGVILDWVPAHFPRDAHGLRMFDGTPLYEYADPRIGEHKEWGTLIFDYTKSEVISFLTSNAYFWFDKYHIDGLRVDAVSSMLYRNYNRRDGEWIANEYGGMENLEVIEFFRNLNSVIFGAFPNVLMIAEESTAFPSITKPAHEGGLGFNYKWNMGWMNDMLRYMSMDPYFRKFNHNLLTFSMFYAFSENYILPLSHDEVVHGKRSLIDKMYGTYEEKFASLRLFYAYMMAHPGKKLLFMGGEFGQFIEWRYEEGLDWLLFDYDSHYKLNEYVKALNSFYKDTKAFWEIENSWDGFEWINANDENNSVVSFIRKGKSKSSEVIVVCNFTPVERQNYQIGVNSGGSYEIAFNSDDEQFGGNSKKGRVLKSQKKPFANFKNSLYVNLPPLSAVYITKTKQKPKKAEYTDK